MTLSKTLILGLAACAVAPATIAAPEVYTIEPMHTYPSFEASHMGLSYWRGKFDKTSGKVWLDRAGGTGRIEVTIDATSVDFGLPIMNRMARGDALFKAAKYPTATYKSDSITFKDGVPVNVNGSLTLLGITKPVLLEIRSFKCRQHPLFNREVCGADAYAQFNRLDFGMTRDAEADPTVRLAIQIEAIKGDSLPKLPPPAPGT